MTYYANYNEASRAPTVVELGCANPQQPCGLPNDFASDPDLKQVVARTLSKLGLRGNLADQSLNWSADVFRTINTMTSSSSPPPPTPATSTTSATPAGRAWTWRLGGKAGSLSWRAGLQLRGCDLSVAVRGQRRVQQHRRRQRQHRGAARATACRWSRARPVAWCSTTPHASSCRSAPTWSSASGSYLHGNENNANQAGATNGAGQSITADGTGWIPSYSVVNLQGTYHLGEAVQLFARVVNLLNKQYATAGFLTTNTFTPNGTLPLQSG